MTETPINTFKLLFNNYSQKTSYMFNYLSRYLKISKHRNLSVESPFWGDDRIILQNQIKRNQEKPSSPHLKKEETLGNLTHEAHFFFSPFFGHIQAFESSWARIESKLQLLSEPQLWQHWIL